MNVTVWSIVGAAIALAAGIALPACTHTNMNVGVHGRPTLMNEAANGSVGERTGTGAGGGVRGQDVGDGG